MVNFEEHFTSPELVEFEIEGAKFKYKPVDAGDENNWLNEYMVVEDGFRVERLDLLNKCKLRNIMETEYSQELIQKVIGINKAWGSLNTDERFHLLSKLKPTIFTQIILKMKEIDSGNLEVKKNSSKQLSSRMKKESK